MLLLHEFDVEIQDRKGTENQVVDNLSKMKGSEEVRRDVNVASKENFLDEQMYAINNTNLSDGGI